MELTRSLFDKETKPERIVILGSSGFIGSSLKAVLEKEGIPLFPIARSDIDFEREGSGEQLASLLRSTDVILMFATITPRKGKGTEAFFKNLRIAESICKALTKCEPIHFIYLSSDTVYPLDGEIASEVSSTSPENLFGAMHLAREYLFREVIKSNFISLRSTLVYGVDDPHNSYGPNRMRRMAKNEKKISLFGAGEENRDHIFIDDLINLIRLTILYRTTGVLNLVTGESITYLNLAEKIKALFEEEIEIVKTPRMTPITHRHFDPTLVYKLFPYFSFTPREEALEKIHSQECQLVG